NSVLSPYKRMSDRSVTLSCARAGLGTISSNRHIPNRMRLTILHAVALLALSAVPAQAQAPPAPVDPFAAHAWHFETDVNAAHEELYGLNEGVTYGLKQGLVLRANQRFTYVSQRSEDAVLLGLTIGVRGRVYRRGRLSVFLQGDLGISHTAVATPPRGTR